MTKNRIVLYTDDNCKFCKQVKEVLKRENIIYTEKIKSKFMNEWEGVIGLTGLAVTPTFVIDGRDYYIPGRDYNDPQQLIRRLKNLDQKEYDYPVELRVDQALKTLTYGINQSLNMIFTELKKLNENKLNK